MVRIALRANKAVVKNAFNSLPNSPKFYQPLKKKAFENILEKGENAGKPAFSPFPKIFLPIQKQISIFESHLFYHLQQL